MAENQHPLPDISGVFNIDESRIPKKIIAKPESPKKKEPTESILLRPETRAESKQQEKMLKTVLRERKKKERKQVFRKRLIAGAAALGAILALVLVIRAGIVNKKKPVVTLVSPERNTLYLHYDTEGCVLVDRTGEYEFAPRFTVVFIDNEYDTHGVKRGSPAEIIVDGDQTVSGIVQSCVVEESDSELISKLMQVFADASFSSSSNTVVTVVPDDYTLLEEDATVTVRIVTDHTDENVLTLPQEAVFTENGQDYVWLYRSLGKKVKRQNIKTGMRADGLVEVSGIKAKDKFAMPAAEDQAALTDNGKVRLAEEE